MYNRWCVFYAGFTIIFIKRGSNLSLYALLSHDCFQPQRT